MFGSGIGLVRARAILIERFGTRSHAARRRSSSASYPLEQPLDIAGDRISADDERSVERLNIFARHRALGVTNQRDILVVLRGLTEHLAESTVLHLCQPAFPHIGARARRRRSRTSRFTASAIPLRRTSHGQARLNNSSRPSAAVIRRRVQVRAPRGRRCKGRPAADE
jgi:hypothetical protein